MDLDQFALDPQATIPVPTVKLGSGSYSLVGISNSDQGQFPDPDPGAPFPYHEVREHPYLHLFPGLQANVEFLENGEREGKFTAPDTVLYNPNRELESPYVDRWRMPKSYRLQDGITHFIYHPWFQPIRDLSLATGSSYAGMDTYQTGPVGGTGSDTEGFLATPHWFGDNSTRGVLSDAVAQALTQARKPGTEETSLPLEVVRGPLDEPTVYATNWSLANYLRTPLLQTQPGPGARAKATAAGSYRIPIVQWEFLHPELPIIKVTAFSSTQLPLRVQGEVPGVTDFAVSFVISFQNRWASFDDPNRWLIRFQDEMKEIHAKRGSRDSTEITETDGKTGGIHQELHEDHFPNYWHTSDYMQHRIIGPVVAQVYPRPREEREARNPIAPGIYAVHPRVDHWQAPGAILTREQAVIDSKAKYGYKSIDTQRVRTAPQGSTPDPGWPLPGHVMTNPATGPGTGPWKEFRMDGYDW